ncbi:MAG: 50S ribosomal protein L4, partial [Nanoarchaeota archaeon]|nr:50S ribosomal protein L4 [Nanoarchaeota archaeon]
IWSKKINAKERKKAIRSALAATMTKELVAKRGHAVPDSYPFIIEDKFETLQKTKDVKQILEKLGFEKDLARALSKTLRGGIAKMRGRKYRVPRGPLIVVSDDCPLKKAASNIPGVDIITAKNLNVELLAPGGECGRLTLFTESAIEQLKSKNLFLNIKMKQEKRQNPAVEKKETAKKTAKGMKPAQKPEAAPKKQQAAK